MAMAERVLVAVDESGDDDAALGVAREFIRSPSARLTVMRVLPATTGVGAAGAVVSTDPMHRRFGSSPALEELRRWMSARPSPRPDRADAAIAFGVPGVEIVRTADAIGAGLIVLGRRPRSPTDRHVLGETADAVVRRSPHPVLFVPPDSRGFRQVLVALDGTDRASRVLEQAHWLATELGAKLSAVTVEAATAEVAAPREPRLPMSRSIRLAETIRRFPQVAGREATLAIRSGNPIEEVLNYCSEIRPDVLVIGYRRGGPPKVMGPTDIARNLLYGAPSAVYTVPL